MSAQQRLAWWRQQGIGDFGWFRGKVRGEIRQLSCGSAQTCAAARERAENRYL